MRYSSGTYKLWFGYLQLAIRSGVPINEKYYSNWGTPAELEGMTFNRWWRERGKAMFAFDQDERQRAVTVERTGAGYVVLKVATDVEMDFVKRRVGEIVRQYRGKRRTRSFSRYKPTSQVNYKTLAVYKRLLEIHLAQRQTALSLGEKISLLKETYAKIHKRMKKQRETLRRQGERGRRLAGRWRSHEPDAFDTVDDAANIDLKSFSPKKAHRWVVSGQLVMLNVAKGQFPGDGYYGRGIAGRLRNRRRAVGLLP